MFATSLLQQHEYWFIWGQGWDNLHLWGYHRAPVLPLYMLSVTFSPSAINTYELCHFD